MINNIGELCAPNEHKYTESTVLEKNPIYQSLIYKILNDHKEIIYEKTKLSWDEKEYFLPDMHPNKEGHKKLMEEVASFLIKHKLLPCEKKTSQ